MGAECHPRAHASLQGTLRQASHGPRGQGKGGEEGQPRGMGRPGHGLGVPSCLQHYGTPGSWAPLTCKAVGRQRSGGWRGEVPPHRAGTHGTGAAARDGLAAVCHKQAPGRLRGGTTVPFPACQLDFAGEKLENPANSEIRSGKFPGSL